MKLLTETQTAEMLGLAPGSLKVARCTNEGEMGTLPFYRLGRSVRYNQADVIAWAEQRRVSPVRDK